MRVQPKFADLQIARHDTVFLMRGRTEKALKWINENVPRGATTLGPAIAVNSEQIIELVKKALADGLELAVMP